MKEPKYFRRFDYSKSLLPNSVLADLEEDVTSIEQAIERTGYTIGYPGWNLLYYLLLSHLKPGEFNVILETGSNIGCSTIAIAQALKDSQCEGRVYSIELIPDNYQRARDNLSNAGLIDLVDCRVGDSKLVLKMILEDIDSIRVAFLDASHLMVDVLQEFELVYPRLQDDGLVIFDNTYQIAESHEDQRVFGALHKIKEQYGGNLINLEFVSWYTPGVAIWQKKPFPAIDTPCSVITTLDKRQIACEAKSSASIRSQSVTNAVTSDSPKKLSKESLAWRLSAVLGGVLKYYSRWTVGIGLLAIALNIAAFLLKSPWEWIASASGIVLLLFLIGHAAAKADSALEELKSVKRQNRQAIANLRKQIKHRQLKHNASQITD